MFLSIAGVAYNVQRQGADMQYARIGAESRAFSGVLRSTIRAEKRMWKFVLGPMQQSEYDTLYAAVKLGTYVTVTGDAVENVPLTAVVVLDAQPYEYDATSATTFNRSVGCTITEV